MANLISAPVAEDTDKGDANNAPVFGVLAEEGHQVGLLVLSVARHNVLHAVDVVRVGRPGDAVVPGIRSVLQWKEDG